MIRTDLRFPRHAALAALVDPATAACQLAHDQLHVERVYRWCVHLADACGDADGEPAGALSDLAGALSDLAGAAGLLHDLIHIPKNSPDRPLGSEQSAKAAGSLLRESDYSDNEAAAVVEAIRTCSWSRGLSPTGPLGRILQDADRLDAIGAIGISRCFACAQEMADDDSALYHPDDPAPVGERELDDRHYALDHFFAKLIRLSDSLHTPLARTEAKRRHQFLLAFADEMATDVRNPLQEAPCQSEA